MIVGRALQPLAAEISAQLELAAVSHVASVLPSAAPRSKEQKEQRNAPAPSKGADGPAVVAAVRRAARVMRELAGLLWHSCIGADGSVALVPSKGAPSPRKEGKVQVPTKAAASGGESKAAAAKASSPGSLWRALEAVVFHRLLQQTGESWPALLHRLTATAANATAPTRRERSGSPADAVKLTTAAVDLSGRRELYEAFGAAAEAREGWIALRVALEARAMGGASSRVP